MSWAQRRKATYGLSFLFLVCIILAALFYLHFNKPPSCFDGIQNEGETGVDCGGPCARLCQAPEGSTSVVWTRWAEISNSGIYSVLAYIDNPNINAGAYNVPYSINIYDENGLLLYTATSTTYIPPDNTFAVFQDGINLSDKVPARIEFQFTASPNWQTIQNQDNSILLVSKTLEDEDTAPKLLATIQNTLQVPVQNIQSVAILYDANGNAIAFSKTQTDTLAAGASANIVFTWPQKFDSTVDEIDIISEILPN